jgi:hypothetical protein
LIGWCVARRGRHSHCALRVCGTACRQFGEASLPLTRPGWLACAARSRILWCVRPGAASVARSDQSLWSCACGQRRTRGGWRCASCLCAVASTAHSRRSLCASPHHTHTHATHTHTHGQSLELRLWPEAHPLRQLEALLSPELLFKLEDRGLTLERLADMGAGEIGAFLRHPAAGALPHTRVCMCVCVCRLCVPRFAPCLVVSAAHCATHTRTHKQPPHTTHTTNAQATRSRAAPRRSPRWAWLPRCTPSRAAWCASC